MRAGFIGLGGVFAAVVFSLAGCVTAPLVRVDALSESALGKSATLAAACSGCHVQPTSRGTPARSAIVSLVGYPAELLVARLQAYKQDPTGTSVMHRLARGYGDEQISAIAGYLALNSQSPATSKPTQPND